MKQILLVLAALGLAACAQSTTASLSPAQCDADWASVGAADGADGATSEKFAQYQSACARGGATLAAADEDDWRRGWRRGVERFCAADPADDTDGQRAARGDLCAFQVVSSAPASDAERASRRPDVDYGSPTIRPRIGLGVGIGSGGVRVGGGVGLGVGIFNLGVFF